jgi:hypothetical protein
LYLRDCLIKTIVSPVIRWWKEGLRGQPFKLPLSDGHISYWPLGAELLLGVVGTGRLYTVRASITFTPLGGVTPAP